MKLKRRAIRMLFAIARLLRGTKDRVQYFWLSRRVGKLAQERGSELARVAAQPRRFHCVHCGEPEALIEGTLCPCCDSMNHYPVAQWQAIWQRYAYQVAEARAEIRTPKS